MIRVAYTLEQCWHEVPGGTAVAAIEAARALAQRAGVELVGVAARHPKPPRPPFVPPISVRQLLLPRALLYEAWHRVRRPRVDRVTGTVDVIHATTIALPPRSAPLVVTIHDLAWRHSPARYTRHGRTFFERGLNLALAEADLVLCPSTATFRDCERAGFEVSRLEVVPFGVDVAPATEAEIAEVRRRYGLDREYVLFVGTIEPGKNLAGLIAAFGTLEHPVDLVVGGPRGWNQESDAPAGDSHPDVKRLGFIPPEHLGPLYAGARVFCLPSFMEGFGFPVLEAMAQGTPVVTSRGTSTEELAGAAGVLVDPHDAGSIAEGLRSVLDDEDRARKLGELGRARAATFTWARTARLTEAAYAKVAA